MAEYISKIKDSKTNKTAYLKDEEARTQLGEITNKTGDISKLETTNKTNLVSAINEVFQSASNGKSAIVTALTGKGIVATENDTFLQLAEKIGTISEKGNTFNITNNLTNCSNNNSKTTIEEYNSYKANINADTGYRLDSVAITMGGTDITSICYTNGTIHIEDVTGHLIITVSAVEDITPVATLNWNFENTTAGNGAGDITLSVNDASIEGDYAICYANNNGVIDDYDTICTLSAVVDTPKTYTHFNEFQMIPNGVTKLVAMKDNVVKSEFVIPENKRFNNLNFGNKLYTFGMMSDVHIDVETSESDFATAFDYYYNTCGALFSCISGDVTNGGTEAQFKKVKAVIDAHSANNRVYATNGNHENYNTSFSDKLWETYIGNPRDYAFVQGNDAFVFLALRNNSASMFTNTQMTWLEQQLEKFKTCRIFLFTHCFINGTGNGNYNNLYPVNWLTTTNTQGRWLLNLLKANTNVLLFTGHSHLKFITQELDGRVTICNSVDGVKTGYLVHIPSITIPRDILNGSSITDYLYAQSEGVVIDVYEKGILYRGRNFINEKFIPIGQFMLPLNEGTKPTQINYVVTNQLSNATSSNANTSALEGSSYTATITPNANYNLDTVTITMGGINITETAYSNGVINIAKVTGDIVIKVTTVLQSATLREIPITMTAKVKLDKITGAESTNNAYGASNFIKYDNTHIYTVEVDSEASRLSEWNINICYYDDNSKFVSYSPNGDVLNSRDNTITSAMIPKVEGATQIRLRIYNSLVNDHIKLYTDDTRTYVACEDINVTPLKLTFTTNNSQNVSVKIIPENCTEPINYVIDKSYIANVDNGVVTPIMNGTCNLIITCGAISKTIPITVSGLASDNTVPEGFIKLKTNDFINRSSTATTIEQVDANTIKVNFLKGAGKWYVHPEGLPTTGKAELYVEEFSYSKELTEVLKQGVGFKIVNSEKYTLSSGGEIGLNSGSAEFNVSNSQYLSIGGTLPLSITMKNVALKPL